MSTWTVLCGRSRPCAVCGRQLQRFEFKAGVHVDCRAEHQQEAGQ